MQTVAEIRSALQAADARQFDALVRALAADERKGVRQALEVARRRIADEAAEEARIRSLYDFQRELAHGGVAVGLDEVGRGPLAGPLAVGAVVLPDEPRIKGINDSKKLAPSAREELSAVIRATAVAWDVEFIGSHDIDELGISACLKAAFSRAVAAIECAGVRIDAILLDGNPLHIDDREVNVVKGDARCASISCASIIAKVERDAYMRSQAAAYPAYGFEENKGYGSAQHIEAIKKHGLTPLHRASFCRAWTQDSLFG